MITPLIGTGFYASVKTFDQARKFLDIWLKNTLPAEIVIVDNSEVPLGDVPGCRVVRVKSNLGSWGDHAGQFRPHLVGWSISWMLPALIAYSEKLDLLYKEQDCLCFGNWLAAIGEAMDERQLQAGCGYAVSAPSRCETALFCVRRDYITEFVSKYISIPEGDGVFLCEDKLGRLMALDKRVSYLPIGQGRDRPIKMNKEAWFLQKTTEADLAILRENHLI